MIFGSRLRYPNHNTNLRRKLDGSTGMKRLLTISALTALSYGLATGVVRILERFSFY